MLMLLNTMVMVKVLYYDDDHEEEDDNVDDEVMMTMMMVNVLDDPNEVERLHSTPVQVRKVLMMMTMIMAGSRKYKSTRGGQEPKLSFFCEFYIDVTFSFQKVIKYCQFLGIIYQTKKHITMDGARGGASDLSLFCDF